MVNTLRDKFARASTARPAKSTQAIVDKLKREKIRLAQMQDIAGCRVIVSSLSDQDRLVSQLLQHFENGRVYDRVSQPSHGYRAKHLVVKVTGRLVEVQVRTELQHLWAAMSEKVADFYGHGLKYGHGHTTVSAKLLELSDLARDSEVALDLLEILQVRVKTISSPELDKNFDETRKRILTNRLALREALEQFALEPRNLVEPDDLSY